MVVVDSSALIPLAWVGRLDLITDRFDEVRTTEGVRGEVLVEGKPGTAALDSFLDEVTVRETPSNAERVAQLEGIAVTDAAVVLLAAETDDPLLANDGALVDVGRAHGVDCWWVTTLLLAAADDGTLTAEAATDLLYDLVDEGMNLHPRVYTQIQSKLRELGDSD